MRRACILSASAAALIGATTPAPANMIRYEGNNGPVVVMDNQPGADLDPRVNTIRVNFTRNAPGWMATGTILAFDNPGMFASTTLTNVLIENLAGPPDPINGRLVFSQSFAPIAPSTSSAFLDGSYDDTSGLGFISLADIRFNPLISRQRMIGVIDPPAAMNVNAPVPFAMGSGPLADNRPVTFHVGFVNFDLGLIGDAIRLPLSASIHTFGPVILVPEPAGAAGFGVALAGLAGVAWRRRRASQRSCSTE